MSGLPPTDGYGEVASEVYSLATAGSQSGGVGGGSGFFAGIKSALMKAGTPYAAASSTAAGAMSLISPWLSNVVWTINRVFFTLAREAYGGNAVVYATWRLLSTAVAEPPLVPHLIDNSKNRQELDWNHPLYQLVRHPNELMTEMGFVELSVIHMGLAGRCHWWKERDNIGRIIALWPLRPDRVGPLYAVQPVMAYGYAPYTEQLNTPTNVVTGAAKPLDSDNRILAGWTYWPPGWSTPIRIPREDVMTINLADPAGESGGVVEGIGPVMVLAREIEADNEATSYVAALLKNKAQPGGILHVKSNLMRDRAAMFKREFKKMFGGANRGEIAIFDGDTVYQEIGFNMQQLEFPDLRKISEARITASAGVPLMLVGFYSGLESANRSTLSEFREYFAETTLPGWWRRIQEQYTYDVAREFDPNALVTFDTSKVKALLVQAARTIQPYQIAFTNGVLKVNEYRQNVLGLPPLEGPIGEMLYLPSTSSPVPAGASPFDFIGTGVAANYGADAPDPELSPDAGRIHTPGDKPTTTPRLPGHDAPSPDSSDTSIPSSKAFLKAVKSGTGVCYTCGNLIEAGGSGFTCASCLRKKGFTAEQIEAYTHIGDRGKPWIPDMMWRHTKTVLVKIPDPSDTSPEPVSPDA